MATAESSDVTAREEEEDTNWRPWRSPQWTPGFNMKSAFATSLITNGCYPTSVLVKAEFSKLTKRG